MATTIWERVESALTPLALPMGASAFLLDTGTEIPDTYLVYFVISITPEEHADNVEIERSYLVQVSIYCRAGLAGLPDVIGAMTATGFTFSGGRDLGYEVNTRHYGISFDFEYLEDL
jgi:hypothetical protein